MSKLITSLLFLLLMSGSTGCTVDFSPAKEKPDASGDADTDTDTDTDSDTDA
ncbi:MAG: hypothetical protein GY854_34985, partial [Deltaproteobacteria bacterium]|nr:hypothetical protein [Deltaproteobacteria bacterium]